MPKANDLESEIRDLLKIDNDEPLDKDSACSVRSSLKKQAEKLQADLSAITSTAASENSDDEHQITIDLVRRKGVKKTTPRENMSLKSINKIFKSQNKSFNPQKAQASSSCDALKPDLRNLDADEELKKMISGARRTHLTGPTSVAQRRNPFIRLKGPRTYSTSQSYVGEMQKVPGSSCIPELQLKEDSMYQVITRQAEVLASSGNINGLQTILSRFPCHLDTLYYTFNLLVLAGESSEARLCIEHAMYCIGEIQRGCFFSWTDAYSVRRVPFGRTSNRVIHLTISAYAHALLRQNCTISAFEVLKILFNLDSSDPTHSLFNIEYCGMKNANFLKLSELLDALPNEYQTLPNVLYTKALCLFHTDRGSKKTKASNLLSQALERFPSFPHRIYQLDWRNMAPDAPFEQSEHAFLENLSAVYSARNSVLWHVTNVKIWVKECAQKIPWKSVRSVENRRNAKLLLFSSKVAKYYSNVSKDEVLGKQTSTPMEVLISDAEEIIAD